MAEEDKETSLKVDLVKFQDPLGANKSGLESEDEGDNSDMYYFSQISPATSKYNNEDEDEEEDGSQQKDNNNTLKNTINSFKILSKNESNSSSTNSDLCKASNNLGNKKSNIYRHNNMIFHNITPTTPKKQIYSDNTTPTKASSNTSSPRRTVSLKTSTPINQNKNCFSPTPTTHSTPNNFPSHYTSIAHPTTINDMDIIVDSPEKHSSLMESYVTFRITTHTSRSEYKSNTTPIHNNNTSNDNNSINNESDYNNTNKSTKDNIINHTNCNTNNTNNTNNSTTNNTNITNNNNTNNCNQVRRRFNDFLWLREQLEQQHPSLFVPPLPDKQRLMHKFSPDLIKTRIVSLNRFLSRVCTHPIISFNPSFLLFLTAKQWELKSSMVKSTNQSNGAVGGVMSRLSQSLHSIGGHMLKNRPIEFEEMGSRLKRLSEKLKMTEKVANKMVKEQMDLLTHVHHLHSCLLLWSTNEECLAHLLTSTSQCLTCQSSCLVGVIDSTELNVLLPLREYILYVEVVKSVLRRRDTAQLEHDQLRDMYANKKQDHNVTHEDLSKVYSEMESANDRQSCVEADLRAEFDRWTANQRRDLKSIFRNFSENQMKFYQTATAAWEGVVEKSKEGVVQDGGMCV